MSPIISDCRCQEPAGGGGGPSTVQEIEWTDYITELVPEASPPSAGYSIMNGGPISLTVNNPSATNALNILVTASTSSILLNRSAYGGNLLHIRGANETGTLPMSLGLQIVDVAPTLWPAFDPIVIIPAVTTTRSYSIGISSSVTIEFDEIVSGFYDDGSAIPIGMSLVSPARISVIAVPG